MEFSHIHISDAVPSASVPPASKEDSEVETENRTIILCFDSTGNANDAKYTNVLKLYSLLRKDKNQLCYYNAGVGKSFLSRVFRTVGQRPALLLDQVFAWDLHQHVIDGYTFLMRNYHVGDRVCLFGFSHGALAARALAGMLSKVGLLLDGNKEHVSFAYRLYRSTRSSKVALVQFKETFCRHVPIDFVGVWDTVADVGHVIGRFLPFGDSNSAIRVFRHGLSLDEHRTKFRPNLYHHGVLDKAVKSSKSKRAIRDNTSGGEEPAVIDETDVKEVWFAGCHRDVGGGNASSDAEHALANIPFRWMIQEIKRTGTHIMFDENKLAKWNITRTIRENPDRSIAHEQGGGEKEDAVQPITDPLSKSRLWWILEVIPTSHAYEKTKGRWKTKWRLHRGSGRQVPPNSLFHSSVKTRMEDPQLKYIPKANYNINQVEFVS